MPTPSRLVLASGALVLAALVLFFVPPLFLGQGGVTGPGASGSAGASGAVPSTRVSVAPTKVPAPTPKTYTVKSGDTLSTIAKRFGVTVEEILAANKNIKNPNKIAIGDVIVIPSAAPSEVLDGGAPSSP
jgi:LysM repeat protein